MKKAILVISFGTSYKETREKTIETCEQKLAEAFDGYDLYRAFTSNIIIKKVARVEGVMIDNPIQALERLKALEYEEVMVQPLHLICGEEYCKLKEQVEAYKDQFKKLILGRPLLAQVEDYKAAIEAVKLQLPTLHLGEGVVFMGHGTTHEAYSAYCALDYMFEQEETFTYVGTVEGYPGIDEVIRRLHKAGINKIYLMPFLLVAGDHAINDMASDEEDSWKSILIAHGFEVEIILKGLGENPAIRQRFVIHAKEAIEESVLAY